MSAEMTNETPSTPEAPNAPGTPEPGTQDSETPAPPPEPKDRGLDRPEREAAKYRRQLREAETERDTLRGQVEAMQRAEVERLAGVTLAKPAGIWTVGTQLDDMLTEAGTVDPVKVTEAVKTAMDTVGLAPVPPRSVIAPKAGTGGGGRPPSSGKGFAGAFAPPRA